MANGAATAPRSKLEEQATAKADLSYSYWAKQAATDAPTITPQPITDEEAAGAKAAPVSAGASAWNHAGTFEERNVTEWARGRLGELLVGLTACSAAGGASASTTGVQACAGDAHVWLVRGKRRCGFEFDITLNWRAEVRPAGGGGAAAEEVTGTLQMANASADELDELALAVKPASDGKSSAACAAAAEAARALRPQLVQKLVEFHELLKQR